MASPVSTIIPERQPLVDDSGFITRPWFMFLLGRFTVPPATIAVPAPGAPFVYQNQGGNASVIVSGGTVSLVEFSRDGVSWFDCGTVAGMFTLSGSDRLRVTYTAAPSMTLIPR